MINWKSVSKLGDRGILIEFPQEISEKTFQSILDTKAKLLKINLEQKVEITNTYNSILISYPLTIRDIYSELNRVSEALGTTNISKNINFINVILFQNYLFKNFMIDIEIYKKNKSIGFFLREIVEDYLYFNL